MIAVFLVDSQKAIMPNERFESWNDNWESLQKKMGYSVEIHHVQWLAAMKLVLIKSGCTKEGDRFYTSITFAEMSNMDYVHTRDHMIKQDKLVISSNIYNSSSVSFGEDNVRKLDDQPQEYYEWNRRSGNRPIERSYRSGNYESEIREYRNRDDSHHKRRDDDV